MPAPGSHASRAETASRTGSGNDGRRSSDRTILSKFNRTESVRPESVRVETVRAEIVRAEIVCVETVRIGWACREQDLESRTRDLNIESYESSLFPVTEVSFSKPRGNTSKSEISRRENELKTKTMAVLVTMIVYATQKQKNRRRDEEGDLRKVAKKMFFIIIIIIFIAMRKILVEGFGPSPQEDPKQ
ncbi:hypothetical protein OCU04_004793 [Sclerotinia nivalis]|uniref:Uncharacterized protein n=1 Tax=Sclerotinia nivalis TaxID=352851 RepID=A0A9X0AR67_9HELO|nr:hypothetical protein OCU04_004793 [Sclerotinia nivalis]